MPLVIEAVRTSGAAAGPDGRVVIKRAISADLSRELAKAIDARVAADS